MSLSKLQEMVKDKEAWHAAVHEVTKSRTWVSDWTTTTTSSIQVSARHPHALPTSCILSKLGCISVSSSDFLSSSGAVLGKLLLLLCLPVALHFLVQPLMLAFSNYLPTWMAIEKKVCRRKFAHPEILLTVSLAENQLPFTGNLQLNTWLYFKHTFWSRASGENWYIFCALQFTILHF